MEKLRGFEIAKGFEDKNIKKELNSLLNLNSFTV